MKWKFWKKKSSDHGNGDVNKVIDFINEKIAEYTQENHKMSSKERIEFDILSTIMKIIRKSR